MSVFFRQFPGWQPVKDLEIGLTVSTPGGMEKNLAPRFSSLPTIGRPSLVGWHPHAVYRLARHFDPPSCRGWGADGRIGVSVRLVRYVVDGRWRIDDGRLRIDISRPIPGPRNTCAQKQAACKRGRTPCPPAVCLCLSCRHDERYSYQGNHQDRKTLSSHDSLLSCSSWKITCVGLLVNTRRRGRRPCNYQR
jgi:hypothetical protein